VVAGAGAASASGPLKQYEIWWAELPEPAGRRPVLLLSRTPAYEYLNKVVVVEITSTVRSIPQEVTLSRREGLSRASVANLDNLHVVAKKRLTSRIGILPASRAVEIKRALGHALGWSELRQL
jgi:mRNA-degrading endonuclease toxin of MazEF toxin-antitoxin module